MFNLLKSTMQSWSAFYAFCSNATVEPGEEAHSNLIQFSSPESLASRLRRSTALSFAHGRGPYAEGGSKKIEDEFIRLGGLGRFHSWIKGCWLRVVNPFNFCHFVTCLPKDFYFAFCDWADRARMHNTALKKASASDPAVFFKFVGAGVDVVIVALPRALFKVLGEGLDLILDLPCLGIWYSCVYCCVENNSDAVQPANIAQIGLQEDSQQKQTEGSAQEVSVSRSTATTTPQPSLSPLQLPAMPPGQRRTRGEVQAWENHLSTERRLSAAGASARRSFSQKVGFTTPRAHLHVPYPEGEGSTGTPFVLKQLHLAQTETGSPVNLSPPALPVASVPIDEDHLSARSLQNQRRSMRLERGNLGGLPTILQSTDGAAQQLKIFVEPVPGENATDEAGNLQRGTWTASPGRVKAFA